MYLKSNNNINRHIRTKKCTNLNNNHHHSLMMEVMELVVSSYRLGASSIYLCERDKKV